MFKSMALGAANWSEARGGRKGGKTAADGESAEDWNCGDRLDTEVEDIDRDGV